MMAGNSMEGEGLRAAAGRVRCKVAICYALPIDWKLQSSRFCWRACAQDAGTPGRRLMMRFWFALFGSHLFVTTVMRWPLDGGGGATEV